MSNNNANLWWAYDSESSSFTALPASPFLLPAVAIMAIMSLFGMGRVRVVDQGVVKFGDFAKSEEYLKCKKRYKELMEKWYAEGELDGQDHRELAGLMHPKWNNHELWYY